MFNKDKAAMGAFAVGGLLLFGFGLFLIGDRRMLFSKSADFYTEFAQISALESGAKVRVGGMDAGEVLEVRVPPAPGAKFQVKFKIIEKLFPVIRSDSVASIQTDGLLGNKFLLIDTGTTGMAPPGYTLRSREPFEIGDLLGRIRDTVASLDATVQDVKGDVSDATQSVAGAAKHIDQIIVSAQEPIQQLSASANRISSDASDIIARVNAGEGTIGKLMNDNTIFNNFSAASGQIEEVAKNLRQTSADVQALVARIKAGNVPEDVEHIAKSMGETSERLKTLVASFQPPPGGGDGVAGDVRATLVSTREAMSDLSENLEALKHGFFFRGYFKDRGYYDLGSLSPAEYQSKEFEKNVTKQRVWVQQGELFVIKAGGVEELSDSGKARLNTAVASFLQYSKDRAIIVESYSTAGTVDEQFLLSRDRSAKVRDYLMKKFALSPDFVGAMPMGAFGGHGESIALVLLKK